MSHPHNEHRAHKVEKNRVGRMTRGYASGGAVDANKEEKADIPRSHTSVKPELRATGGPVKARADRPGRKRGGRTKSGGHKTVVNVIGSPHPGAGPMAAPPMAAPAAAAPMVRPPMPAGPPMGGMPPPGAMPPPGMHAKGGRVKGYKKGGAVSDGPAYKEGVRNGTQPWNLPGKNDLKQMFRGKPVTYKTGGAVESSNEIAPATKLPGGSGGGEARLTKAYRYKGKPGGLYS